jgi:transcriptional regulator with XRE-family HTH domain
MLTPLAACACRLAPVGTTKVTVSAVLLLPKALAPNTSPLATPTPGEVTVQTLSEAAELHVNQIRRYEAGTAQPTLEALIRLAKALHVSLDSLVFEEGERGPDEDLRLRFEALAQLDSNERMVVKELLDGMLLKHQARRLAGAAV